MSNHPDAALLLETLQSVASEGRLRALAVILEADTGLHVLVSKDAPIALMSEGVDVLVYDRLKLKTRRKPRKKKGAM